MALEQLRHAQAHVSDGDDPNGGGTHVYFLYRVISRVAGSVR